MTRRDLRYLILCLIGGWAIPLTACFIGGLIG